MAETGPRRLGFVTRLLDRVTRGQRCRLKAEKIVQRSGAVSPRAAETLGLIRLSDLKSARERLARSSGSVRHADAEPVRRFDAEAGSGRPFVPPHDVNYQQTYVMGLSWRPISRGNRRRCPAIQVGD